MEQIGVKCSMRRLKQIEESKKLISEAFLRLLQYKSINEISISQIAKEAKIGRNTFYTHFQKKEDVLYYMMHGILEEVKEELSKKSNLSIRDFLLWRFTFIKNNPLMAVFRKHNEIKQLFFHFREKNSSVLNFYEQKDIYVSEFFQGGIDYVTSKWILSGMKESPDEMTNKILSLIMK